MISTIDFKTLRRFWAKTTQAKNGCIVWIGAVDRTYGQFKVANKRVRAHRFSIFVHKGAPVESGRDHVLHACDNRLCVNPLHLSYGSNAENVRERVARRGR